MEDPMVVRRGVEVPLSEIKLRTSRSSGPGGQHANVTASRVEAVFDVESSTALSEAQKRRVMERLGPTVTAVAQDARGQARNRELALERLRDRLASALRTPRARRPTAPSATARRRRVDTKRRRGQLKRQRRARPEIEE
jgi:ribosome-associated protein